MIVVIFLSLVIGASNIFYSSMNDINMLQARLDKKKPELESYRLLVQQVLFSSKSCIQSMSGGGEDIQTVDDETNVTSNFLTNGDSLGTTGYVFKELRPTSPIGTDINEIIPFQFILEHSFSGEERIFNKIDLIVTTNSSGDITWCSAVAEEQTENTCTFLFQGTFDLENQKCRNVSLANVDELILNP